MCFFLKYESSFKKKRFKTENIFYKQYMYFGFRAPALRCAVSLFQHLYPPWSPVSFSLSHSLLHTWGFCESWPCCTVIGEEVKRFKKILKLFLFLSCIWSISYPRTPLLLPAATWKMLWQIWGPCPSHSALQGPCCFPIYRRHPLRSPPRHTGNQKTSGANLQVGGNSHWLGHHSSKGKQWCADQRVNACSEWVNGRRQWTTESLQWTNISWYRAPHTFDSHL